MIMDENILTAEQRDALHKIGIDEPNAMQMAAVENCRKTNGMVLLSPTGTGKTLAYLLPLLERLDATQQGIQAFVIVPSRELAGQVAAVWRGMDVPYRIATLHGGRPVAEERAVVGNSAPAVIVGTPGRVVDHLEHGNIPVGDCSLLVIDEFDKCLEMGFLREMERLLGLLPSLRARFLLSATDAVEIPDFAGAEGVVRLDFRTETEQPTERIRFRKITVASEERLPALASLLCSLDGEPVMVFCNFRESVDEVRSFLAKNRLSVAAYHGAMEQKERELALFRFTSGCVNVLVCTDLAARGLDIKDVRHVVHYQRPMTQDIFTHRNGRTARYEADGSVYMIVCEGRPMPDYIPSDIAEYRTRRGTQPVMPLWMAVYVGKGKRDKISRGDIAGFFMKKGGLPPDDLGSIALFDRYSYIAVRRNKVRSLLAAVSGEKIKGMKTIVEPARV